MNHLSFHDREHCDRQKLKELIESSHTPQQLLSWMQRTPGWQGDDFKYCLETVKNSRILAEFSIEKSTMDG